ncbi:MAG: rhomboid family intramembrane serine protease [Candidatus Diapherotrites archaeon]|uniref:Rhomboid family intramembrane serine protease n=1 Tax=Candidatus Iainarchaeum sp. TaxID=3101447 RepID=A0A8T3YMD5_9ARCH|nr:rhomboid family intramembrane serine protease [Candidatus Diapherotrites archaeon]
MATATQNKGNSANIAVRMNFPRATFAIIAALVLAHAALSGGFLFQKSENVSALGFSLDKPLNVLPYNFVHVDYTHLIMNLAVIAAAGLVLEGILGRRHVLALFFLGSAVSAFLFALYSPEYAVVGSSAGAIAMLGAAFSLDTRKAAAFTAAALVAGTLLVSAGAYYVERTQESLSDGIVALESQRQQAIAGNDMPAAREAEARISESRKSMEEMDAGIRLNSSIPPSSEIHVFASLFGVMYAYVFSRKALEKNSAWLMAMPARAQKALGMK